MSKNIIICFDGTGNQFGENNSNVVKLYRVIERNESQIGYYDPGVGTLADPAFKSPVSKKISKLLGLGFGVGILRNVQEAYSFLMDTYNKHDRLFMFGFSRGAYTARVLAGFIHSCGLLEAGCQNMIPYAMKLFKCKKVNFKIMAQFKSTYGRNIKIDFLGLWDSVSTIGWIFNPLYLPYTTNNASVKMIRHALAIDEKRSFFREMRWGKKHADQQNIKQVWFAGVHSDVGGGYPEEESGLSKIALEWMIKEAMGPHAGDAENPQQFALEVNQKNYDRYVLGKSNRSYTGPDSTAIIHESLKGLWKLVQWIPRSIWLVDEERQGIRKPPPFRTINIGETLHTSVLERIEKCYYNPPNLNGRSIAEIKRDFNIEPDDDNLEN